MTLGRAAARLRRTARWLCTSATVRAAAGAAALLLAAAGGGAAQTPGATPATVHLYPGWNNVPYFGEAAEPTVALAAISGRYSKVWHWDAPAQRYAVYDPANPAASDLKTLLPGHCYWIVATVAADFALAPPGAGVVPALTPGWNNLVYTGIDRPVAEALASLRGHYGAVYQWDAALQRFRTAPADPTQPADLARLTPLSCAWLYFS